MTEVPQGGGAEAGQALQRGLDTSVAHPARVYNYWLGGKDHFAADREAAEAAIAVNPFIVPGVRTNREFLVRAVRYLAVEAGVRQFLDIGTGIPSANNTHESAQAVAPESRVVYVDNDPVVLVHARALLTSTPEGVTAYLEADLRDRDRVLRGAAATLDFSLPVAVLLLAVLQFIGDSEDPYGIVAGLMDAVVPGSYLVISHPASDIQAQAMASMARSLNERQRSTDQVRFRTHAEVSRLFDQLELVGPGLVQPPAWRPDRGSLIPGHDISAWCGVARKP